MKYLIYLEVGGETGHPTRDYINYSIHDAETLDECIIDWLRHHEMDIKHYVVNDNKHYYFGRQIGFVDLPQSEDYDPWKKLIWIDKSIDDEEMSEYCDFKNSHSERVKQGLRERALSGKITFSDPPYGYELIDGNLKPRNDDSVVAIKKIFELYLQGYSCEKIATKLTDMKILTPGSYKKNADFTVVWYGSSVRKILKNQVYIGNVVRMGEVYQNEKTKTRIPSKNPVIFENNHQAIIDKEIFESVQFQFKKRGIKHLNRKKSQLHMFTKLLKCKDCGKNLTFFSTKNAYVCSTYRKKGVSHCSSHRIEEGELIDAVRKDLLKRNGYTNMKKGTDFDLHLKYKNITREMILDEIEVIIVNEDGEVNCIFK